MRLKCPVTIIYDLPKHSYKLADILYKFRFYTWIHETRFNDSITKQLYNCLRLCLSARHAHFATVSTNVCQTYGPIVIQDTVEATPICPFLGQLKLYEASDWWVSSPQRNTCCYSAWAVRLSIHEHGPLVPSCPPVGFACQNWFYCIFWLILGHNMLKWRGPNFSTPGPPCGGSF